MLTPTTVTPLTIDTDNGRTHNYPCIVISPSGQQFVFYEKFLTTGKESYSRITFTDPSFVVNIEAGNGTVNAIPVTWGSASLTVNPNSYALVYVDTDGNVGLNYTLDMSFMKDVIQLAYVSSGSSSITRIEELEHSGYYIYLRKQTLSGSNYVWDNVAHRLNTGEQPKAFYCTTNGNIYLTYQKDDAEYVRVFDPTDELTWEYLPSTNISANTITMNNQPQNSIVFGLGSGYEATTLIENGNLYPLGDTGFCFINGLTYIYLPIITDTAYFQYVTNQVVTYEVMNKINGNYYTEAAYTIDYHNKNERWKLWSGTIGNKYIRITVQTAIMPTKEYITDSSYYASLRIYDRPAETIISSEISNDTRDDTLTLGIGSGYEATITKTAEYVESRTAETDSITFAIGSGYEATVIKTSEFIESRAAETDSITFAIGSGYEATLTFVSL